MTDNPFETPVPRGVRLIQGTLRVTVAIQCWGMAAARLHLRLLSPVGGFLDSVYDIPAAKVAAIEDYLAYALVACGLLTLLRPCWPVLIPVAAWEIAVAAASVFQQEGAIPALVPAVQAVQCAVPLALLLVDFWPPRIRPTLSFCLAMAALLRLATAATFAGHGLLALSQFRGGGELVELIVRLVANVFHRELDPELAQQALAVIGAVDIAAAFVLLTSRSRACAAWMTFWGLLAATSPTLAYGLDGYHQTLLRVAEAGAPLSVLLFWLRAVREQRPVYVPGDG